MAKPSLYNQDMLKKYTAEGYWHALTISDYWEKNAQDYPDKEAIVDSRSRLTWSQAKVWVDRLALGFLEMGLKKDEVVVIQLPNCVELACLRVACERAGLLHLPAQRLFRHAEMEHILKHTQARAIVIPWKYRNFDYYDMVREIKPSVSSLEYIIIWGEEIPQGELSLKNMLSNPLEKRYPMDFLERKKMSPFEFSLIGTTTGTTGKPKFIEAPICALIAREGELELIKLTGDDILGAFTNAALGPNAVVYCFAPLVSARVVMLEHWDVEAALNLIEKEKITVPCVVPTQLVEINSYPELQKFDLRSLRVIWCTGSMLPYHMALELEDKLNCPIINVYGATDFGGMSGSPMAAPRNMRLLSVGRPFPGNELKIIDGEGKEVKKGEIGRIAFRGAKGFSGYYKDPETTAQNWTKDGWYITGDLGKLDEDGYLHIAGRNTDMIIRGGQNIYPLEIENILLTHPKIADVSIVGMLDSLMGERTCACVVFKQGEDISLEELVSFLKDKRIATYKLPEKLLLFDSLPYVSDLKLDRKRVRSMAMERLGISPQNLHSGLS